MQIDDCEFIESWFQVLNSVPHVTLYVRDRWASKDLGLKEMLKGAEKG